MPELLIDYNGINYDLAFKQMKKNFDETAEMRKALEEIRLEKALFINSSDTIVETNRRFIISKRFIDYVYTGHYDFAQKYLQESLSDADTLRMFKKEFQKRFQASKYKERIRNWK